MSAEFIKPTNKISIALCTYNGAKYLPAQLESYLRQSRMPDEVVIGDDLSGDETLSIIERFAMSAPFPVNLKVNKSTLGSTRNFEETIRRCSGDLIFLSDQDDIWMREKIEKIEQVFVRSKSTGLVFTDAELVDDQAIPLGGSLWDYTFPKKVRKRAISDEFYRLLLQGDVVTGATAAFRSSFAGDFSPIPTHIPDLIHDGWLALVISVSSEIGYIDSPLIQYRQHSGQQLGVNWNIEASGSRRERFSRAKEVCTRQLLKLKVIRHSLNDFSALARDGKIGRVLPGVERNIEEHIIHLENRLTMSNKSFGRIPLIMTELTSGRYHKFSNGFLSLVKDVVAT